MPRHISLCTAQNIIRREASLTKKPTIRPQHRGPQKPSKQTQLSDYRPLQPKPKRPEEGK